MPSTCSHWDPDGNQCKEESGWTVTIAGQNPFHLCTDHIPFLPKPIGGANQMIITPHVGKICAKEGCDEQRCSGKFCFEHTKEECSKGTYAKRKSMCFAENCLTRAQFIQVWHVTPRKRACCEHQKELADIVLQEHPKPDFYVPDGIQIKVETTVGKGRWKSMEAFFKKMWMTFLWPKIQAGENVAGVEAQSEAGFKEYLNDQFQFVKHQWEARQFINLTPACILALRNKEVMAFQILLPITEETLREDIICRDESSSLSVLGNPDVQAAIRREFGRDSACYMILRKATSMDLGDIRPDVMTAMWRAARLLRTTKKQTVVFSARYEITWNEYEDLGKESAELGRNLWHVHKSREEDGCPWDVRKSEDMHAPKGPPRSRKNQNIKHQVRKRKAMVPSM
ncbi:expressed unknown protein [Seminavis robusta]|uniref:Uncharacterized protein n=1 Tax=Seminavis robusta TaxID=568900 RepID=A0A9N8DF78_9STRA|nr:expressed unknown protein [Seminavis robusta]|eukprot:Sro65_g037000.1 n/a (397) ;mRNA; f:128778-130156